MDFCAALRSASPIFHFSRNVYIYVYIRLTPSFGAEKALRIRSRGKGRSAESIWAYVYSFKKIARLHFPQRPLRGASKTPNKP